MVTLLTGTSDGEGDTGRMPSSDTGNLSQTLVRLARQLLGVPTAGHSLETLSLRHSNDVDHLVLAEHLANRDGLLEMLLHPVDLVFDGATVQLDLHDVRLLLALLDQTDLCGKKIQTLLFVSVFQVFFLCITCEWAMMRMVLQYRIMVWKSWSMDFLPKASAHFLLALVKAFFLLLYLASGGEGRV